MKVKYVLNNYQIWNRFYMTPTHKVISQERIDPKHTEVTYQLDSIKEKESVSRALYGERGKSRGKIID